MLLLYLQTRRLALFDLLAQLRCAAELPAQQSCATAANPLRTNPTPCTAYGCAAACAQKRSFCCKPYGLLRRPPARFAEQASKGFVRPANPRCCYATSRVCLANPRGHFVTSQLQIVDLQRYAYKSFAFVSLRFASLTKAKLLCARGLLHSGAVQANLRFASEAMQPLNQNFS